jgi:hypothetical protein
MALSWDVSDVKNHDSVCFFWAPEDDPSHGVSKGDRLLNPVTNMLIWATISVDLPGITKQNAGEFFARLRLTEKIDGPFLIRAEVDGVRPKGEAAFVTPEEVVAHIGLKCNVTPKSRTAWLKKFGTDLDRSAQRVETLLTEQALVEASPS